jgi:hypothetical protein
LCRIEDDGLFETGERVQEVEASTFTFQTRHPFVGNAGPEVAQDANPDPVICGKGISDSDNDHSHFTLPLFLAMPGPAIN